MNPYEAVFKSLIIVWGVVGFSWVVYWIIIKIKK